MLRYPFPLPFELFLAALLPGLYIIIWWFIVHLTLDGVAKQPFRLIKVPDRLSNK